MRMEEISLCTGVFTYVRNVLDPGESRIIFTLGGHVMHDHRDFFIAPSHPTQKLYEALRAFYVDHLPASEIAQRFGWSVNYFRNLRSQFHQTLMTNAPPQFFVDKHPGPRSKELDQTLTDAIVALRKCAYSVPDIHAILQAQGHALSVRQISKVLTSNGFPRLPRRTRQDKLRRQLPHKIVPPKVRQLSLKTAPPTRIPTRYGGLFLFLPFLNALNLPHLIQQADYPHTNQLTSCNYLLALLFLKLIDKERLSHIDDVNLDAGAGLFTGLNLLPRSSAISAYSYSVTRQMNHTLLKGLHHVVDAQYPSPGEIALDFTAIPHWGDQSVLERNWNGSRAKALKSILALIARDMGTGFIPYGNAEITHHTKNDAIFQFVDFWKEASDTPLKCLIFDSKFTTYENLSQLNHDGIKFITLRRRGKSLVQQATALPKTKWNTICLDSLSRKYRHLKVHESQVKLHGYDGTVRQVIITNHGRQEPAFLITNDFQLTQKLLVTKYARRWLVEQSISEQIHFFHLNLLSSSIVIKVDLDLTMTIAAHTLYRLLANTLPGFEQAASKTIFRHFIETSADIDIDYPKIHIHLLKKAHYPILFEQPLFQQSHTASWLDNATITFSMKNTT